MYGSSLGYRPLDVIFFSRCELVVSLKRKALPEILLVLSSLGSDLRYVFCVAFPWAIIYAYVWMYIFFLSSAPLAHILHYG